MWKTTYKTRYRLLHPVLVLQEELQQLQNNLWKHQRLGPKPKISWGKSQIEESIPTFETVLSITYIHTSLIKYLSASSSLNIWNEHMVRRILEYFHKAISAPSIANSWLCLLKLVNAFLALLEWTPVFSSWEILLDKYPSGFWNANVWIYYKERYVITLHKTVAIHPAA